jgi:urea transport system permease protein
MPPSPAQRLIAASRTLLVIASLGVLFAPPYFFAEPTNPNVFQLGLFSKYLAWAILALSVDLVWGYTGLLSLGQGLFFGLGAYCVAYCLKMQEAASGEDLPPGTVPPDFMEYTGPAPNDPDYVTPPALTWIQPLSDIWIAFAAAILLPMLVALIFGLYAFRPRLRSLVPLLLNSTALFIAFVAPLIYLWWQPLSASVPATLVLMVVLWAILFCGLASSGFRIHGVYFSLITQAVLLAVFTLINNQQRVTGGKVGIQNIAELQLPELQPFLQFLSDLFGREVEVEDPSERYAGAREIYYFIASVLLGCLALCALLVRTKFGKLLTAIRDNENRVLALGYNTALYKTFVFTLAGGLAGLAGGLFAAANGRAHPDYLSIANSIVAVIWVAVGGRGGLLGAVLGAILVGWANSFITSALPDYWEIVLGAIFLLVVIFLPRGLVSKAGRGALAGGMIGIILVDSFVKDYGFLLLDPARSLANLLDCELTDKGIKIVDTLTGCLFVLAMVFVPRLATLSLEILGKSLAWFYRRLRPAQARTQ